MGRSVKANKAVLIGWEWLFPRSKVLPTLIQSMEAIFDNIQSAYYLLQDAVEGTWRTKSICLNWMRIVWKEVTQRMETIRQLET